MCIKPSDNNKNKKIKYQFAYMSFDHFSKSSIFVQFIAGNCAICLGKKAN